MIGRFLWGIKNAGRQFIGLKVLVHLSNDKRKTTRAQSARASTLFSLDFRKCTRFSDREQERKTQICLWRILVKLGLNFPTMAQNDELCDDFSIRGFKDWHLGMGEAKIIFKKIARTY